MQLDTSQRDVTMILPGGNCFETQLTAVKNTTYQINTSKRQISAHNTATIQTLFWALMGTFCMCDITL